MLFYFDVIVKNGQFTEQAMLYYNTLEWQYTELAVHYYPTLEWAIFRASYALL